MDASTCDWNTPLVYGHNFSRRMLAGLVQRGLAAEKREVMKAGGKVIEVVRVRIMGAGRRSLEVQAARILLRRIDISDAIP